MIFLHINLYLPRQDVDFARHANLSLSNEFEAKVEDEEHGNLDAQHDKFLVVECSNEDGESTEDHTDDKKQERCICEIRLERGLVRQSISVNALCLQRPMELQICQTHGSPREAVRDCGDTREPEDGRALVGDIKIGQAQNQGCEQDADIWYSSVTQ